MTGPKMGRCPYCGYVKDLWDDGEEYVCPECYDQILTYGKQMLRDE